MPDEGAEMRDQPVPGGNGPSLVRAGEIVIPEIQGPFVRSSIEVRVVMDSLGVMACELWQR